MPVRAIATEDLGALRGRFAECGQEHVFRFWAELDRSARDRLAAQAGSIDLPALARIRSATQEMLAPGTRELAPAPIQRLPERGGDPGAREHARERGEQMLADGTVAALVVAGGQGTRLGFPGPKGTFPLGPVSGRTLFELQAQKIRGLRRRYGRPLPWLVMTSPATDEATRQFFASRDWLGLPESDVFFFCQATVPALDFEGRLILEAPDRIAESPDGHGGSLTALERSGALDEMAERGVTTLSYYQVDNPLVRIADPVYLGFHAGAGAEMSAKVVSKRDPMEKMGVVALSGGELGIVEYTELDDEHRYARDEDGELVYWAGSTAIHLLETSFVRRVSQDAETALPFHASAKKIPFLDEGGSRVEPAEPNGYKLERFVFDALPAARCAMIVEACREEEYAPVKNAEGGDSPETARQALIAEVRRWLLAAGLEPPGEPARIEVDHSFIDGPEDARQSGIRDVSSSDAILVAHGAQP
jgi:UDP-N-acetylglucosamine/UDP-N-acetylgalactosamine diphosphorylase